MQVRAIEVVRDERWALRSMNDRSISRAPVQRNREIDPVFASASASFRDGMSTAASRTPLWLAFRMRSENLNRSASEALGDVSRKRQLEMRALECLNHQDNPENQSEQVDEIEEKCASRESSPATKSASPPMHAKDRAQHGLQNVEAEENNYGLCRVESHISPLVNEEKD